MEPYGSRRAFFIEVICGKFKKKVKVKDKHEQVSRYEIIKL